MSRRITVISDCEGCGACCRTVSVPPFRIDYEVNETVERSIPADLLEELLPKWEVRFYVSDSPCLWFDESQLKCRHYELRPQACRDFEVNSPSCLAIRQEYQIQ